MANGALLKELRILLCVPNLVLHPSNPNDGGIRRYRNTFVGYEYRVDKGRCCDPDDGVSTGFSARRVEGRKARQQEGRTKPLPLRAVGRLIDRCRAAAQAPPKPLLPASGLEAAENAWARAWAQQLGQCHAGYQSRAAYFEGLAGARPD